MLVPKTKGVFVEVSDFSILAAVTSTLTPPFRIESLQECPVDVELEQIQEFIGGLAEVKARGYLTGHCSVYPKSRFIRRTTLESPAKAKDPAYLVDLLTNQFRIDPAKNGVAVVNAIDGTEFDAEKNLQAQKELVFCGATLEELQKVQDRVVEWGIYPQTVEIGSLNGLGGLKNYLEWKKIHFPTLVLEITPENSNIFILSGKQVDIARPIPYGLTSMFPSIKSELGLKDEESAKKLFYSNTFDFTEMGPILLKKMLKELQASTGFYEVQTGQTIGQIFMTLLPNNFNWMHATLSRALGVDMLHLDYPGWLKQMSLTTSEGVQLETLDSRWLGLFSLMGNYDKAADGA